MRVNIQPDPKKAAEDIGAILYRYRAGSQWPEDICSFAREALRHLGYRFVSRGMGYVIIAENEEVPDDVKVLER